MKYNFAQCIHQTENPEVGLDILSNRFKDAQKLDTELADYFKERYTLRSSRYALVPTHRIHVRPATPF